jgi:predicted lipoprotein
LEKDQAVGKLVLELPEGSRTIDLLIGKSVPALGLFDRIGAALKYVIFGAGADVLAGS